MATRQNRIDDAARRAEHQVDQAVMDLRAARLAAGITQAGVARAVGYSRQQIGLVESRLVQPSPVLLARMGAAVGLDVSIRTFPGGSPLRDAGQLRLLRRFREAIGHEWAWQTEVPVSTDPRDRRAMDVVMSRATHRIGAEAIVRLTDAQAQTRGAILKQKASGTDRMVLVLANTRHNRAALRMAAPTLTPAFPLEPREILRALRAGALPLANGVVFA